MRATDSTHFPLLYLSFFEFLSSFGLEERASREKEGRKEGRDELIISALRETCLEPNMVKGNLDSPTVLVLAPHISVREKAKSNAHMRDAATFR